MKVKHKDLLKNRREMVSRGTTREDKEYAELCKTIRKLIRQDIREHNTLKIKEAVQQEEA